METALNDIRLLISFFLVLIIEVRLALHIIYFISDLQFIFCTCGSGLCLLLPNLPAEVGILPSHLQVLNGVRKVFSVTLRHKAACHNANDAEAGKDAVHNAEIILPLKIIMFLVILFHSKNQLTKRITVGAAMVARAEIVVQKFIPETLALVGNSSIFWTKLTNHPMLLEVFAPIANTVTTVPRDLSEKIV